MTGFSQENLKAVEGFRDSVFDIKKRWDNRLAVKVAPLGESYFAGNFHIALYGDWATGTDYVSFVVSIESCAEVNGSASTCFDIVKSSDCYGERWGEVVVFIEDAKLVESPNIRVSILAGSNRFFDKCSCVGGDSLYFVPVRGVWKFLPLIGKGEVNFLGSPGLTDDSGDKKVKRLPQIVNRVSDDTLIMLRDWLFGDKGQVKAIRISQRRISVCGAVPNDIQVFRHDGGLMDKRINMALGPFDL